MSPSPERGPSRSSGQPNAVTQLKSVFVLLVALSSGLIAFQGDASLAVIGAAILGGLVAGGVLVWYLVWIMPD